MERLLKLFLSIIIVLISFSCQKEVDLNPAAKRILAEKRYKKAIQFRQGSTPFQNGIADAVSIDPLYEAAVYELSVAHLKRGMPHKWKPQYDKAIKLDSVNRIPWRGYLYLWFYRDYKKAIADFDASDVLTPNFIDNPQAQSVDYWRGIAYLGLKDYKKSIYYFDKLIKLKTEELGEEWIEITAFLYRGIALYEIGEYEKANDNFDKLLKYSDNKYADGKYYKALIYKNKGNIEKSKQFLISALEDFHAGYINSRPYVETLRQLYLEDYIELKLSLDNNNK